MQRPNINDDKAALKLIAKELNMAVVGYDLRTKIGKATLVKILQDEYDRIATGVNIDAEPKTIEVEAPITTRFDDWSTTALYQLANLRGIESYKELENGYGFDRQGTIKALYQYELKQEEGEEYDGSDLVSGEVCGIDGCGAVSIVLTDDNQYWQDLTYTINDVFCDRLVMPVLGFGQTLCKRAKRGTVRKAKKFIAEMRKLNNNSMYFGYNT